MKPKFVFLVFLSLKINPITLGEVVGSIQSRLPSILCGAGGSMLERTVNCMFDKNRQDSCESYYNVPVGAVLIATGFVLDRYIKSRQRPREERFVV